MKVDKIILDAMVQGRDVDEIYWKQLLLNPNREELWQGAIDRRRKIDNLCRLAIRFPSVATGVRKIKSRLKVGKKRIDATFSNPSWSLSPRFSGPTSAGSIFSTLGDRKNTKRIKEGAAISKVERSFFTNGAVNWGETHIEEYPSGQKLTFNSKDKQSIHYAYDDREGWISSDDQWEVKLNDGAVVLTFFDQYLGDSLETTNLDMALQSDFGSFCLIIIPIEKPN